MKSTKSAFGLLSLVLFLFALNACTQKCTETRTYIQYTPIEKDIVDIRSSFVVSDAAELERPGKIYVYNNYLFVVERNVGFHIIDNTTPSAPTTLKFVTIDGCNDIAVRGNTLYANQGPDIISLDIADINNIQLIDREQEVMNTHLLKDGKFVVDYDEKEVTEIIEDADCNSNGGGSIFANQESNFNTGNTSSNVGGSSSSTGGSSSGTGGSMARFSIINNTLYTVDNNEIVTFSLDGGMTKTSTTRANGNVETIFGMEDYLFLGTTTGMLIYNRNNGDAPTYKSSFRHARGCDPVVVDGNNAFVTVRGNGNCGQAEDELHVVDISNIDAPVLKTSHAMFSPYGLGFNKNLLMLCDGKAGFKVFDKSNIYEIGNEQLDIDNAVNAYDVIVLDDYVILTSEEGIFQYSYSTEGILTQISSLIAY